jgi:hypothetical protein
MAGKGRLLHLIWIASLATTSITALAQSTSHVEDAASCRRAAEGFYRWYVPLANENLKDRAAEIAIQRKAPSFGPELLRALKQDFDAQRKSSEIVGIDFDPFVGDDAGENYEVRGVSISGDVCIAEVWQVSSRDKQWKPSKPDVVAELSESGGRWQFTNFFYHDGKDDLVSALTWWRKQRDKQN